MCLKSYCKNFDKTQFKKKKWEKDGKKVETLTGDFCLVNNALLCRERINTHIHEFCYSKCQKRYSHKIYIYIIIKT